MQGLDVFVMPSFTEGTPNSIVEAMASGLPIIATDVGGIPDMIGEDAGILVPAADTEALAQAMQRLAEDSELRKAMGRAARARYLKLFSPEVVLPVLTSAYQRVISAHSRQTQNPSASKNGHPWQEAQI
jgi:glycosyltransferase involved in cell wall biosynthesis